MSSYRASSGDALRSLTPCLSAELCAVVWQEPGCPHMSAICLRCTSSARRLSSICRQAIIMAWMLWAIWLMTGYTFSVKVV
jgi:hypothetical protein